jgi:hypothetical protein
MERDLTVGLLESDLEEVGREVRRTRRMWRRETFVLGYLACSDNLHAVVYGYGFPTSTYTWLLTISSPISEVAFKETAASRKRKAFLQRELAHSLGIKDLGLSAFGFLNKS